MNVEVIVDEKYTSPKAVIYCNNITNEISSIINSINNMANFTIIGYLSDKKYILDLKEIYSFYSDSGKVYAKTDNNIYIVKYRIYELENLLNLRNYIRISNSEIVNFSKVKSLDFSLIGTIKLNFSNDTYTYVSRRYIKKIKQYLST